jgi:hypothetical protein
MWLSHVDREMFETDFLQVEKVRAGYLREYTLTMHAWVLFGQHLPLILYMLCRWSIFAIDYRCDDMAKKLTSSVAFFPDLSRCQYALKDFISFIAWR